jgi:hypothetical protein
MEKLKLSANARGQEIIISHQIHRRQGRKEHEKRRCGEHRHRNSRNGGPAAAKLGLLSSLTLTWNRAVSAACPPRGLRLGQRSARMDHGHVPAI